MHKHNDITNKSYRHIIHCLSTNSRYVNNSLKPWSKNLFRKITTYTKHFNKDFSDAGDKILSLFTYRD